VEKKIADPLERRKGESSEFKEQGGKDERKVERNKGMEKAVSLRWKPTIAWGGKGTKR